MTEQTQDQNPFDPTVDIFVGLASVIILTIILILPFAQTQAERFRTLDVVMQQIERPLALTVAGAPVLQILAKAQSIIIVERGKRHVFHQDQLIGNLDLDALLQAGQDRGAHPLLFVAPSGQEAAFLLETILARHAYAEISRIFLDQACGFLTHEATPAGCDGP